MQSYDADIYLFLNMVETIMFVVLLRRSFDAVLSLTNLFLEMGSTRGIVVFGRLGLWLVLQLGLVLGLMLRLKLAS